MTTLFQRVAAGTDLLGTNPTRFFEFGTAPALEQVPYATWQELQGTPLNVLEGAPSTDHIKAQIDIWASTAAEARTVAKAVRRCIDGHGLVTFYQHQWDELSGLYRTILHYQYAQEL